MEITTEQYSRMTRTFQEAAGDQPVTSIEIIRDCFYIFTTELGMYRIADKYTRVASKGFSKNLNTWYVAISRGM